MRNAWSAIDRLIKANATHRKGFKLKDLSTDDAIKHMQDEVEELAAAPDDMMEVLDIMAICIHLLVKSGWSEEEAERALIGKLEKRFTIP